MPSARKWLYGGLWFGLLGLSLIGYLTIPVRSAV